MINSYQVHTSESNTVGIMYTEGFLWDCTLDMLNENFKSLLLLSYSSLTPPDCFKTISIITKGLSYSQIASKRDLSQFCKFRISNILISCVTMRPKIVIYMYYVSIYVYTYVIYYVVYNYIYDQHNLLVCIYLKI